MAAEDLERQERRPHVDPWLVREGRYPTPDATSSELL
jgi:hypothetical protein